MILLPRNFLMGEPRYRGRGLVLRPHDEVILILGISFWVHFLLRPFARLLSVLYYVCLYLLYLNRVAYQANK